MVLTVKYYSNILNLHITEITNDRKSIVPMCNKSNKKSINAFLHTSTNQASFFAVLIESLFFIFQ